MGIVQAVTAVKMCPYCEQHHRIYVHFVVLVDDIDSI